MTQSEGICGFQVVRIPQENYDKAGRGAFTRIAPRKNGIFYGGIDRMAWFDIDEEFYANTLPQEIRDIREQLRQDCDDFTGIEVCQDIDIAYKLLNYSNRFDCRNELIALESKQLVLLKGKTTISPEVLWYGFDFVSLGNWSLTRSILFDYDGEIGEWQDRLNLHGLVSDSRYLEDFKKYYESLSEFGLIEALPVNIYPIDCIKVGKVESGS